VRLIWIDEAIEELRAIHERAPVRSQAIVRAVDVLVGSPFPEMYRRVEGRLEEHVLSVPPYALFYRVDGDSLTVLSVIDVRRRRESL